MLETVIMLLGAILGYFLLKIKEPLRLCIINYNNKIQLISVALIIFIMGINLGSMENFVQKMIMLGGQSFIFAIIPTLFSIIIVYVFSKLFIIKN